MYVGSTVFVLSMCCSLSFHGHFVNEQLYLMNLFPCSDLYVYIQMNMDQIIISPQVFGLAPDALLSFTRGLP